MKGLWGCSYAVGTFEREVLVQRAGLDGFTPASAATVARRLGVSLRRVRSAQSRGLRQLGDADRADGCAMSSPVAALSDSAETLLAVATAPPLASNANTAVRTASSPARDRVEVLGAQRASSGVKAATVSRATVTLASAGDPAPWMLILILALLVVAACTPLLLRHDRRTPATSAPEPIAPPAPEPIAPPAPEPIAPPAPEPIASPAPEPIARPLPPAPWAPTPPPAASVQAPQQPAPPAPPPPRSGAARAAGVAVTRVASVALTLLMRARHRR